MSIYLIASSVLVVIVLYAFKLLLTSQRHPGPLPPGPKPTPLLGNIFDLPPPNSQDWMHWLKHKDKYGPISSITVMGKTIVILSDLDTTIELLVKRSSKYSSRPHQVFVSEMVGFENFLAMQPYSPLLRSYRKAVHQFIGTESAVAQFNSLQEVEAHRFLLRVLEDQTKLIEHIQTEAGAIILKMAYGYTIEPHKRDSLVHIANLALERFVEAALPGNWLVDLIPWLKFVPEWFPGAGFKRTAKLWKKGVEDVADIPYAFSRKQIEEDRHQPSYVSKLLNATNHPPVGSADDELAKWTAASLYTGGADTTVCAMEIFFLAMTIYPEVQHKAQAELDRVLGPCQLPTAADSARLPYLNAVVQEVLRWQPVAPLGLAHASTEDDTVGEYFIPKGSLILPNVWAMTHDPATYHDPMTFKPERFLGTEGREPELSADSIVFGFGRRICPARMLATATVFLTVARSLAVFKISKAVEDGKEIDVEAKFQPKGISHPVPWRYSIEPRSAAHEVLIRSVEKEHPWENSNSSDLPDMEL